MTGKKKRQKASGFSPELLHAISADEIGCFVDLHLLSTDDVAVLKQIIRGEKLPPMPIDKKRVVNALARSDSSAEASEILARVVSDKNETTRIRATAAVHLSLMPQNAAEKALIRNLNTDDENVRIEVIKSLGRVGAARAFNSLKELPELKTDYAKRQLSLAKLAISFRSGLEDDQDENGPFGIQWSTQTAREVEGKRVRAIIEATEGLTHGISLNPNTGFEIECRRTKFNFLLNKAIKQGAFTDSILSRNLIAGLIVAEEPETRQFTVRYQIMTSPSEEGVEVIVTRANGDMAYVGELQPDGDELQLAIRDVGLDRLATEIKGCVSNDSIRLELRTLRGNVRPKKHPVPIRL